MSRDEVVEALRCASDLCSETIVPLRAACLWLGADLCEVALAVEVALGRARSKASIEESRRDLLEAALRIEKGGAS